MWLMLNKGFISIVNKEGSYVARSRKKEHLEAYFPHSEIISGAGTDYKYRVFLNDEELRDFFTRLPDEINYTNFKSSIDVEKEPVYKNVCSDLWHSLATAFWGR
ncbi:MAG: hypothetical protein ACR2HF_11310 [Methylococcaceae bacterium]